MLDPAVPVIPTVILGEDKILSVQLKDAVSGDAIDISAASEIDCRFQNDAGTCLHKRLTTSGVVITSGPNGKFNILLAAAETLLLKQSAVGALSSFEIFLTIGGKITIIQMVNSIQVLPKLYPSC